MENGVSFVLRSDHLSGVLKRESSDRIANSSFPRDIIVIPVETGTQ